MPGITGVLPNRLIVISIGLNYPVNAGISRKACRQEENEGGMIPDWCYTVVDFS